VGRQFAGFPETTLEKGMKMKQLISVLVAAVFAAASVSAIAQDKKADPAEKKAMKAEKSKKAAAKPAKAPKKTQKKGEGAKKDEPKK
jgi:Ni/Co efflux regulator RcnB